MQTVHVGTVHGIHYSYRQCLWGCRRVAGAMLAECTLHASQCCSSAAFQCMAECGVASREIHSDAHVSLGVDACQCNAVCSTGGCHDYRL